MTIAIAPSTAQIAPRSATAYADQLAALLPQGRAWPRDGDAILMQLVAAEAAELARIDGRASDLFEECDPRSALEMLTDWERVAGLPDLCIPIPESITERRAALGLRITGLGGQSRSYFTQLAATLGFAISIDEFSAFVAGDNAGEDATGDDWAHAWRINVLPPAVDTGTGFTVTYFTAGSNAGDLLAGYGSLDLECVMNRAKPAQTSLLFSYPVEPDTLAWFDFTL